jgi:hypothetical protein
MTSQLLYKTRCPKCARKGKDRSGDNLGVYSDGHSFCYSCGHTDAASIEGKLKKSTKEPKVIPTLPEDISFKLSHEAVAWLDQYFERIDFPKCYWSQSERKLYFLFPNGEYQYRYFGSDKDHPKWVGYGINENLLHIMGSRLCPPLHSTTCHSLVLVEDIISAIKVGHITPTLCLFGSNISLKRLATLKQLGYNKIIIWLDWDKKEYAINASRLAQSIGLQTHVIHTQLDPKEYSIEEIKLELES